MLRNCIISVHFDSYWDIGVPHVCTEGKSCTSLRTQIGSQFRVPTCVKDLLVNFEPDPTLQWRFRATCFFGLSEKVQNLLQTSRDCLSESLSANQTHLLGLRIDNNCLNDFELATTPRCDFDPFETCISLFWLKSSPRRKLGKWDKTQFYVLQTCENPLVWTPICEFIAVGAICGEYRICYFAGT